MSCSLPREALFILNLLYKRRCVNIDKGYHSELLCKQHSNKFPTREYPSCKEAIKILLNEGYITKIRKKKDKYYISDMNRAIQTLISHRYITLDGL
jgi:hypothetical protein